MIPALRIKTVDMSNGKNNIDLGFVPSFIMLVDVSNGVVAIGEPDEDILEFYGATDQTAFETVSDGVESYTGEAEDDDGFAGIMLDPTQFNTVASDSTILIAGRANY